MVAFLTMLTFRELIEGKSSHFFDALRELPFAGEPRGDLGDAWFCAEASALAYKNRAFIQRLSESFAAHGNGWKTAVFDVGIVRAVLLTNRRFAILAFRGTRIDSLPFFSGRREKLDDLQVSLQARLKDCHGFGRVHTGFHDTFSAFWKVQGKEIRKAIGRRALFCTGHSLGAALATLAARDLEHQTVRIGPVAALYTFGSPVVGDDEFRRGFESLALPVYRFVHGHDVITALVFAGLKYVHIGDLWRISGDPTGSVSRGQQHSLLSAFWQDATRLPAAAWSLKGQYHKLLSGDFAEMALPAGALAEHAPIHYGAKLESAARGSRAMA